MTEIGKGGLVHQEYAPIHVHSEYSNCRLKDSTIRIRELLEQCKEFNIHTLALTEHDILTGNVQFLLEIERFNKENPDFHIKPILGNEVYVVDDNNAHLKAEGHYSGRIYGHLILLAKNKNGHKQIRELSKIAWENSFKRGKSITTPIDFPTLKQVIKQGDIICSTACLGSLFAKYCVSLYEAKRANNLEEAKSFMDKIKNYLLKYQELFGKDNFFIEIQPNEPDSIQWIYNKIAVSFAEKYDIPYVVSTDAHYLRPENAKDHEIFLKSSEDDNREVALFYKYTYLMTAEEIVDLMKDNIGENKVKTALANTMKIADMVKSYSLHNPVQMPVIDLPDNPHRIGVFEKYCSNNWDAYCGIKYFIDSDNVYNKNLLALIENGLIQKVIRNQKKKKHFKRYVDEIEKNLDVLMDFEVNYSSNFSQYFLVTKKIIDLAWEAGTFVGVARGSAGAFVINYLMDIVAVDAIEANFPYWRFLAKGRKDFPDIDMDFSPLYKLKLMKYVQEYFGKDRVLPISTVGTEGSKSAVLSCARAFDVDIDIAQRISDSIPIDRGKNWSIKDSIFGNPSKDREPVPLMQRYYKEHSEMLDVAMRIEGLINKRSQHASGVLIYPENYLEYNSMMKSPSGTEVSAYTMVDSEYCGGIKEDFLFIEYMPKLQLCLELMRKDGIVQGNTAKELYQFISPDNIDLEDKNIWESIFHTGNVSEIFQMEGTVGIDIVKKLKPNNINELSAANSLMRLKSDINVTFLAEQEGFEDIEVTDFMRELFETEQLSDKYLRYKNNPQEFIDDTVKFGVPQEFADKIYEVLKDTYGVCVTQEDLMRLGMEIFDFSIIEAHTARKGVAKKKGKLVEDCRKLIIQRGKEKGYPPIVAFYVWMLLMGTAAYSFSVVHAHSYSLIGYQGAFLKHYYPLYWHTACLSINAQAEDVYEDEESGEEKQNKTTDYAKITKAIFDIQQEGISVSPPNINKSDFGFSTDKENNLILFGLRALDKVGDEIAQQIIELRPYGSFDDFMSKHILFDQEQFPERKKLSKNTMLSLIFSDSFGSIEEKRSTCIVKYLSTQTNTINNLSTRYLSELRENNILPREFEPFFEQKNMISKIKAYKSEDKKVWKIPLTENNLIQHIYDNYLESVASDDGQYIFLTKKTVNAKFKESEESLKSWMAEHEDAILDKINNLRLKQELLNWTKGSSAGDLAFQATGMYQGESWLDTASEKYGTSEFLSLPLAEDNIVGWGKYKGKQYPLFGITQIPITVIDKNTKHKTLSCCTKGAVITVRMRAETFDYYSKHFVRGAKLIIWGYRGYKGDTFTVKLYESVRKNHIDTHTIMKA